MAPAAFVAVLMALAGAVGAFRSAAEPAAYPTPAHSALQPAKSAPTAQLLRRETPEPTLAALAGWAADGPAPPAVSARVYCVYELWARDGAQVVGQRTMSWRDQDGSGYVTTWTLAELPVSRFTAAMVARTSFEQATYSRTTYAAGQMPHHTKWPSVLAADPEQVLEQLKTVRPGIGTSADLLRALATAHTRYVITREVRAATLMLLATTEAVTVRAGDIPTYARDNPAMPGLVITASDPSGTITFYMDAGTGYLHAAVERSSRRRTFSHTVFLEAADRPWTPVARR